MTEFGRRKDDRFYKKDSKGVKSDSLIYGAEYQPTGSFSNSQAKMGMGLLADATDKNNREFFDHRRSSFNGEEVLEPKLHTIGKNTPKFQQGKKNAISFLEKQVEKEKERAKKIHGEGYTYDYSGYSEKDLKKIKELQGFPTNSRILRGVDTNAKARILKAQLEDEYPETKWSVKVERFAGGSAIGASYVGGKYPYGAVKIGELYVDRGDSDSQSDYYDYDNYVHVYDERGNRNKDPDPQTISDSKVDRLGYKIHAKMDENYSKYLKENGGHHYDLGTSKLLAEMVLGIKNSTGLNDIKASDFIDIAEKFMAEEDNA